MSRPTVCYVASYDPDYSRNVDTVRALRAAGARVEVVRGPIGPKRMSETGSSWRAVRAGLQLALGSLIRAGDVAVRLLRCRVLVIGYFGQVDMLLIAPIARAIGRPVVFSPLVTLSDTIVEDRRWVAKDSLAAGIIQRIDRWSLGLADLVLVDTTENAGYATELAGPNGLRTLVFPVGVDPAIFYPGRETRTRRSGELDVLFYGTFIPLHGVDTIIRAAAIVNTSRPDIRFELIGAGQEYRAARELADSLDATNIRWTDWLPYSELGRRLREADVALGIFDGGEKASRVIPNKVHQALACGTPVVTRDSPAIRRLVTDNEAGLLVPPDDPESLAEALCRLADDPERRRDLGVRGREVWEGFASAERLAGLARVALDRVGVLQA
ncbi:hypothetical protein BH23CHL2_BH23CHL2_02020 [soil metagenome]